MTDISFNASPIPENHVEDAQKIEADGIVELFQILLSDNSTVLYFTLDDNKNWNGNDYEGTGIKIEGVAKYADEEVSRPTLSLFNPEGVYSSLVNQGLLDNATIIRIRVLKDDFENDREIYRRQQWRVSRIANLTTAYISLELRDMMDGQQYKIPARQFIPPDFPTVSL